MMLHCVKSVQFIFQMTVIAIINIPPICQVAIVACAHLVHPRKCSRMATMSDFVTSICTRRAMSAGRGAASARAGRRPADVIMGREHAGARRQERR
jgi:hypothetical protein